MVNKRGFFGFGFKVFLTLTGGFLLAGVVTSYLLDFSLAEPYYDALVVLNLAKHSSMKFTITFMALVHLAVLWMVFTMSLTMSNRISGPMYRLEKVTECLGEGDLTIDFTLRKKDYMTMQAENYKKTLDSFRVVISGVREDASVLDGRLAELKGLVDAGKADARDVQRLVLDLKEVQARMDDRLSFFKL